MTLVCKNCGQTKSAEELTSSQGKPIRRCKVCQRKMSKLAYATNRASRLARMSELYAENKAKVLARYGRECACCAEDEPLFLTVDHVENDGCLQRRSPGRSSHNNIYNWLVRNGFPSGFQILCINCNQG